MPYARFMHGSPGTGSFDIYAGSSRLYSNLSYGMFSDYLPVPEGIGQYAMYPAGTMVNPLVSSQLTMLPGGMYTIGVAGYPGHVVMLPAQEQAALAAGQSALRFINLSPNSPSVDVVLPDGTMLFSGVGTHTRTSYFTMIPATYTFQIVLSGTNQVLVSSPPASLAPGASYTLVVHGMLGSSSNPLRAVVVQDGTSLSTYAL